MRNPLVAPVGTIVIALGLWVTASPAAGQTPGTYRAPRTVDRQPDLQRVWDFRTVTPLERPAELADKEFLTPAEAAAFEKKMVESRDADANRRTDARNTVNGTAETEDV